MCVCVCCNVYLWWTVGGGVRLLMPGFYYFLRNSANLDATTQHTEPPQKSLFSHYNHCSTLRVHLHSLYSDTASYHCSRTGLQTWPAVIVKGPKLLDWKPACCCVLTTVQQWYIQLLPGMYLQLAAPAVLVLVHLNWEAEKIHTEDLTVWVIRVADTVSSANFMNIFRC